MSNIASLFSKNANNGFTNNRSSRPGTQSSRIEQEHDRLLRRNDALTELNRRMTQSRDKLARDNELLSEVIAKQEEKYIQLRSRFDTRRSKLYKLQSKHHKLVEQFNNDAQLHKSTREDLESLQKDKLSTVDRFEPIVDETLVNKFHEIGEAVKTLAMFLVRDTSTELTAAEWIGIMSTDSTLSFNSELGSLDVTQKRARRMLWTNFLWTKLILTLFQNTLYGFRGPLADAVGLLWRNMFLDGKFA
jgi:hypothetical protein